MSGSSDIVRALTPLVEAFESRGVAYRVGGSVATSAYGTPRATLDVDLVCDLTAVSVDPIVAALRETYYIDADMMREAIRRRASFNVIHLETMLKVDVFVLKERAFDQEAFRRTIVDTLEVGADARRFVLATPEDMILHKLEWFRLGDEISERQWLDVLGVLKVQARALDLTYMRRWARALHLDDLLRRALEDAGIKGE